MVKSFARVISFLVLSAAAIAASAAVAEAKRVALVVGNNAYQALTPLQKAVNDARAVKAALGELGFKVIDGENLTRREMNQKLADLDTAIEPGDQVFIFYAGHGVAIGAENYLLPVDMPLPQGGQENLVRNEGHAADTIIRAIQSKGAATTFVVLDACRNNPISDKGTRNVGLDRGLARMDAPTGVFVLFSAGIGQTALDRLSEGESEPNSVFTRKLVPLLKKPGLSHIDLAKELQQEVSTLAATIKHRQEPAYYDQIIGRVVLNEGAPALQPAPLPPAAAPAASEAERAWAMIKDSEDAASLEAYVKRYGDTFYGDLAKARLDKLKRQQQTMLAPAAKPEAKPEPPAPAPVAKPEAKPGPVAPAPAPPALSSSSMAPGTVFRDCPECPEMVVVPAGEFMMGSPEGERPDESESPQHKVTIARPFAIGKHEVTIEEWRQVWADFEDWRQPKAGLKSPAHGVSWTRAKEYIASLSHKTGQAYRLPSEAEWEYAARAGTASAVNSSEKKKTGGCNPFRSGDFYQPPLAGPLKPNAFGLYGMDDYCVFEWVEDVWHYAYAGSLAGGLIAPADGSAWTTGANAGQERVYRGGPRFAARWRSVPGFKAADPNCGNCTSNVWRVGFRVARALTP